MRNVKTSLQAKILCEFDRMLKVVSLPPEPPTIKTPLSQKVYVHTDPLELKQTQGLMRINHTGEICAQALYFGQALFAKDAKTHAHLIGAASEEHDHLYWCQECLDDLGTQASALNYFWYSQSFLLGAFAALFGDKTSYGFVIEIEKQVEEHLQEHLTIISKKDIKTQAILKKMQEDEIRHGQQARAAGGVELPNAIKKAMGAMSKFMKSLVYRI